MAKSSKGKSNLQLADTGLGELEASVMQIVWQHKKATVKDVFMELYPKRRLAYTTIMTVMRRLAEKGVLEQDKSTKTYLYTPKVDQEKMALSIVDNVPNKVMSGSSVDLLIGVINNNELSEDELNAFEAELASAKTNK